MHAASTSPRRRHRRHGLIAALGALAAAALTLTPLTPAHARFDDSAPAGTGPGAEAAIVTKSMGVGESQTGYLPGTDIVPDPAAPYPESPPVGSSSRSGFIGTFIAASTKNPSLLVEVFCIDARIPTGANIGYVPATWSTSIAPNMGYVAFVLANAYPTVGAPAPLTPSEWAAATQAAIWYFTNGYVLGTDDPTVRGATAALVAAAQANGPLAEPAAPGLSVTPASASAAEGGAAGPYVITAEGNPAITVSVADGYEMFRDAAATEPIANGTTLASGDAVWIKTTEPGVTDAAPVLTVQAAVDVPRGSVYVSSGSARKQPLVVAGTAPLEATATAMSEFFAAGDLAVHKVIDGDAAGAQSRVTLTVDCGNGLAEAFDIPAGAAAGRYTTTYSGLPAGTECTIAEAATGANDQVEVTPGAPVTVTIERGAVTDATLTNTVVRRPGSSGGSGSAGGTGTATPQPAPLPNLQPLPTLQPQPEAQSGAEPQASSDVSAQLAASGGVAPWSLLAGAVGVTALGVLLRLSSRVRRRAAG